MDPAIATHRVKDQAGVDGTVAHIRQVDGEPGSFPPAAASLERHVVPRTRRTEAPGVRVNDRIPPHDGTPSLELVYAEVNAAPVELDERAFHSISTDQPFEVLRLAPCEGQQLPVRAPGIVVDRESGEGQEVRLTVLEASAQGRSRFLQTHGMSKEGREFREEAAAGEEIFGGGEASRHCASGSRWKLPWAPLGRHHPDTRGVIAASRTAHPVHRDDAWV